MRVLCLTILSPLRFSMIFLKNMIKSFSKSFILPTDGQFLLR
ncbi:hypothetical protein NBRC111894_2600 [Sporolactobacillus inulinus]|uniref:Uncharacterized protein n=1 Tax=Sporolactobacillus inulinus TaxID=2078 RepID=A0A4Y1ZD73_9BACL|nr:hypothetical protein NBRC111894_2600 [Sporolactobacillus inulinus]